MKETELEKRSGYELMKDIMSLCEDRFEAKTADGYVLLDVFQALENRLAAVNEIKRSK